MNEGHTIILEDCLKRIGELEKQVKNLYRYREEMKEAITGLSCRISDLERVKKS